MPELSNQSVTVLQIVSTVLSFVIVGLLGVIAYRALKGKL